MAVEMFDDPTWGEMRRETGHGVIVEYNLPQGDRNAHVKIRAERLQEPVQGWVDTTGDRDVHVAALRSFTGGQRVFYRIEVRRRDAADKTPYAELEKRAKIREVKEVTPVDGQGLPLDLATPPPAPAQEVPRETAPRPGARIAEARPWEPHNSDGSLNLGSYAVTATESMVLLAHDLLVARWRAGELGNDDNAPPTEPQISRIARMLLLAADRTQAAIRTDGHADRLDNSHTRARAAIRAALDIHPVPFGAPPPAPVLWADQLVATATTFMSIVVSLVDREVP